MELINPNLSGRSFISGSNQITGSLNMGVDSFRSARVWSTETSAPTNLSQRPGAAGNSNGSIVIGGAPSFSSTTTHVYNGSAWSTGGSYPIGHAYGHATGADNDGLGVGGFALSPNRALQDTNRYDGVSWSAGGNLSVQRQCGALGGSSTDALVSAGRCDGATYVPYMGVESYNGATWSTQTNTPSARYAHKGYGGGNDYLHVGGAPTTSTIEHYNGTAWSAGPSLSANSCNGGGGGTANDAVYTLGTTSSPANGRTTCHYNGTAWSTEANATFNTNQHSYGSAGESDRIAFIGGAPSTVINYAFTSTTTQAGRFIYDNQGTTLASGSFSGSFFGSHLNINQANVFKFDCGSCVDDITNPREGLMTYGHRVSTGYGLYFYSASDWRSIDLV